MKRSKTKKARIAVAQLALRDGDVDGNFGTAAVAVTAAGSRGSDLVLLPELWLQGYAIDRTDELALRPGDQYWHGLSGLAARNRCAVAGSLMATQGGAVRNRMTVNGRNGNMLAHYDKIHLFGRTGEDKHMEAGGDVVVVDLGWSRAGLAICYDLRFPELFRSLVREGADIILLAAQWPLARKEHWRTLVRARAIENQVYMVACTRTGYDDPMHYSGGSMVADPWGEVLVEAGSDPTLLTADIDIDLVRDVRAKFPVWQDVRPEVYGPPVRLPRASV